MIRYFDAQHNALQFEVVGPIQFECADYQEWRNAANSSRLIWDGDVPRFKNDSEKIADKSPVIHGEIDFKTVQLIYGTNFTYTYDSVEYTFNTAGKDNYFQDFQLLETGDYPYKVKSEGAAYIDFPNKADHKDFIKFGAVLIRGIVKWGRCLKYGGTYDGIIYDGIHNMTFQELKDFVDPRS